MELQDLDKIVYVIRFPQRMFLYFTGTTRRPNLTSDLHKAAIFESIDQARKESKKYGINEDIVPISKKVFFEASLKGQR